MPDRTVEYEYDEDARLEARFRFLSVASSVVPSLLETLWSDVFPLLPTEDERDALFPDDDRSVYEQDDRMGPAVWGRDRAELLYWKDLDAASGLGELKSALVKWSETHNLVNDDSPTEWVVDIALQTLASWKQDRASSDRRHWSARGVVLPVSTTSEKAWDWEPEPWEPTLMTEKQYRADTTKAFKDHLGRYVSRIKGLAQGRPFFKTQGLSYAHLRWTAEHVVKAMTYHDIAARNESTVTLDAVKC